MKTETLNEYIFVGLVMEVAQSIRRKRQNKMEADGISEEEVAKSPLTQEDRRNALRLLESERKGIFSLLSELRPDLSLLPPGDC